MLRNVLLRSSGKFHALPRYPRHRGHLGLSQLSFSSRATNDAFGDDYEDPIRNRYASDDCKSTPYYNDDHDTDFMDKWYDIKPRLKYEDEYEEKEILEKAKETKELFLRQIEEETMNLADGLLTMSETYTSLISKGKGASLLPTQRVILEWYDPFISALKSEMEKIRDGTAGVTRRTYGPVFLLLPPEKLAFITMVTTMNSIMRTGNQGTNVTSLVSEIADKIEDEVHINRVQQGKEDIPYWKKEFLGVAPKRSAASMARFRGKISKLLGEEEWSDTVKVKTGSALLTLLVDSAFYQHSRAFEHHVIFCKLTNKRRGKLMMNSLLYDELANKENESYVPKHLPMLTKPRPWDNKRRYGAYFSVQSNLLRSHSPSQQHALSKANIPVVLDSLNYLGDIPWRINKPVYETAKKAWEQGIQVEGLPSLEDVDPPKEEDSFRVPKKPANRKTDVDGLDEEAQDIEFPDLSENASAAVDEEKQQSKAKSKKPQTPLPPDGDPYWTTPSLDERHYKEMIGRVRMKNAELHSLRCDMRIKLRIGDKFIDDVLYFPHSMDFRGRAYPVPPNYSHMGGDFCRATLYFAEGKPLGKNGMKWLKVHLANVNGNNKISHDERCKWVDENIEKVKASAKAPLEGEKWWTTAEDPFQALATCIEITAALESGDPESYECRLPVHQDGSCNGLQHYAALGKDAAGGRAVNLVDADKPQDVYSEVLQIVKEKIALDVKIPEDETDTNLKKIRECAMRLQPVVSRKVIKQTVMTSVYGVTSIGARAQIQARLEEIFIAEPGTVVGPELDAELFQMSRYLAALTLTSLREMFTSAKEIMDWLATCANIVASQGQSMSWITPLGLPVVQPYRKATGHAVKTLLQTIVLAKSEDALPVSGERQRSAFPPNFVHSLDATHMMMTSISMKNRDLTFAAVHDSYWTHACDAEELNECIRENFVQLYKKPILENLRESLCSRYPEARFPLVPERGSLDIEKVKESTYFFH